MTLGEFIVSEFWFILLVVSMLLCKQYRVSGILILTIKVANGVILPPFLISMVCVNMFLDAQRKSEKFMNKHKLVKRTEPQ